MLKVKISKIAALVSIALCTSMLTGCDGDDGKAGINGIDGTDGVNGSNGMDLTTPAKLTRLATVPVGAEITGMFLSDNDELFFNVQHPCDCLISVRPSEVVIEPRP